MRFRIILFGMVIGFAVISYVIERVFVPLFDGCVQKKKDKRIFDRKINHLTFKYSEAKIKEN